MLRISSASHRFICYIFLIRKNECHWCYNCLHLFFLAVLLLLNDFAMLLVELNYYMEKLEENTKFIIHLHRVDEKNKSENLC